MLYICLLQQVAEEFSHTVLHRNKPRPKAGNADSDCHESSTQTGAKRTSAMTGPRLANPSAIKKPKHGGLGAGNKVKNPHVCDSPDVVVSAERCQLHTKRPDGALPDKRSIIMQDNGLERRKVFLITDNFSSLIC
ncbi:unnamed protein product [Dicrocoelium dendriticum]|nr:unnamed protein product [Dicrocoelium dendriticum]